MMRRRCAVSVCLAGLVFSTLLQGATSDADLGRRLFQRMVGVPLMWDDPRAATLESMVRDDNLSGAARLCSEDPKFLEITVRDFAAVMSNRELSPYVPLNDFSAMVVGIARDEIDAREMLYGDYRYVGGPPLQLSPVSRSDNRHYQELQDKGLFLKDTLLRTSPQWSDGPGAGVLTSRAWGVAHFAGGTNRRALQYAMQEFLCRPIESWKDASISDDRVRPDVSRAPSANAQEFQTNCRGCHGPMDAMAGAFARSDLQGTKVAALEPPRIAPKYLQNAGVFAFGYYTHDDSWTNYLETNPSFGWKGPHSGYGPQSLGRLLAGSDAFASCMAERAFRTVCKRSIVKGTETELLSRLTRSFVDSGYKLRTLFETVAITPECLGNEGDE